jgi:P4 family phage/plasmid primase-like protien
MTTSQIKNIIMENKTKGVFHSHISMGELKGKFSFNREQLDNFWNSYSPNNNNYHLGFAEKSKHYLPVLGDIDIKIETEKQDNIHTDKHIKDVIQTYQQVMKNILDKCDDISLTCVLLEKPLYHTENNGKKYAKHGFHIHFPYCFLTRIEQEVHLIPRVLKQLDELKTFNDIGYENSSSVIDKSCCQVPWLIYGQSKGIGLEPYLLSKIFDCNYNEVSLENAFRDMVILDYKDKPINISGDIQKYLPRILSILPNENYTQEVKYGLISPLKEQRENKVKKYTEQKEYDNENTEKNIKIASQLMKFISPSRSVNRIDWLKFGWCLFNISQGSQDGFEIWDIFSQLCEDKYDPYVCEYEWSRMSKGSLSLGTLHHYAKEDSPKEYAEWIFNNNKDNINSCMNGSHKNLAIVFMENFGFVNVRITSQKDLTSYIWNDKKKLWVEYGKESLLKIVSDILEPIISKEYLKYFKNTEKAEKGSQEETLYNARLKQAHKMINNLNNASFLKNICSMIAGYDIDKDFETKIMNKSPHELPISGGLVIDLKTLETRPRIIDDFWSFELPVSYLGSKVNLDVVDKFFKDITCNSQELQDYMRRLSGYLLTGINDDRSLHIFYGIGCNGKSSYINILRKITCKFTTTLSEDINIKKPNKGASPELMDLLYARCGTLPESSKKEEINSKRIKTITGDDPIKARHLFGHLVEFETQAKLIWATNHKPKIDIDDQAMKDRLKLIPFLGRFEKTAENTKYIKDLKENYLNEFFTYFCSGAYDWLNGDELIPTQEMNDAMNSYIEENDVIAQFINDTYEIVSKDRYELLPKLEKDKNRTKKSNVFINFLQWIQENERKEDNLGKREFNIQFGKKCDSIRLKDGEFYLCKSINTIELDEKDNGIDNPLM